MSWEVSSTFAVLAKMEIFFPKSNNAFLLTFILHWSRGANFCAKKLGEKNVLSGAWQIWEKSELPW